MPHSADGVRSEVLLNEYALVLLLCVLGLETLFVTLSSCCLVVSVAGASVH